MKRYFYNQKADHGFFKFSQHLEAVYQKAEPKDKDLIYKLFMDFLEDYKRVVRKSKFPRDRARVFLQAIDESIREDVLRDLPSDKKISCRIGCHHCCGLPVSVTSDEFELIRWTAREKGLKISANGSCPFLEDGLCNIYDIRPASCRKYFSLDEPCQCDLKGLTRNILKWVPIRAEALYSAAINCVGSKLLDEIRKG